MTEDNVVPIRPGQEIVRRDVAPSPVVTPGLPVVEVSVFDEPILPRWVGVRRWFADKRWDAEYVAREKWIHAKRSPDYLLRALSFSHVGVARCVRWWWRWAWDLEALHLRRRLILDLDVKTDKAVALVRAERQARKWSIIRRLILSGLFDAGLVAAGWWVHGRPTWQEAPAWALLTVGAVVFLGRVGSDRGQIVQPVTVVMPNTVTEESIRAAAAAAKFGDVRVQAPGPRKEGVGTSWVMELPPGAKHYSDVEADAAVFAANLGSDGDMLDVKPVPGRGLAVNCWLADVDPMTLPAPAWDLLERRELIWGSPWTLGWTLRGEPVEVRSMDAHILVGSQPRKGKALDVETPILTTDGWSTMGGLSVGDEVFHPDGHPTRVEGVFDVMTGRDCYRVTTSDGRSVVADADHLWTVMVGRLEHWDTLTTRQIVARGLRIPDGRHRFRLPRQETVISKPVDLPIDPYLLGAWLGDGTSEASSLTIGDQDLDSMVALVERAGARIVSMRRDRTAWNVGFSLGAPFGDGFQARCTRLGIFRNKHIPDVYLTSGTEQRLALLQGLMDTDGSIYAVGRTASTWRVEFCSTRRVLADGVLYLCRSLGWRASLSDDPAILNGQQVGRRYRVTFTPDDSERCPFRMARKAARVQVAARRPWRRLVSIAAIEAVASRPVRCIKVAREDGLFLAGRDLMVTHNTTVLRAFALAHVLDPRADLAVFNLGGTEDFAQFKPFSTVYRNDTGATDALMAYLNELEPERARRMQVLSGLGLSRLELRAVGQVRPLLVVIDEFHRLTTHPAHGGKDGSAVKRLRMLMQECAKAGIRFLIATQRPDDVVMPNQIRDLCGVRVALKVATWQNSQAILAGDSQRSGLDASALSGRRGEAMVRVDADDADPVATRLRIAPATADHLDAVLQRLAESRQPRPAQVEAEAGTSWRETVLSVWPAGQQNAFTRELAASLNVSAFDLKAGLSAEGVEQRASVSVGRAVTVGYRRGDLVGGLVDG